MPPKKPSQTKSNMTDDQISKSYIELSQQLYKQYLDRRDLEWRIHLTLWTFLSLIAYLFVTNDIHLGNTAYGVFLTIPLHFVWMVKIHKGQKLELNLSIRYRNEAERILKSTQLPQSHTSSNLFQDEERSKIPRWLDQGFESYYWWLGAELLATILISTGVWFLIR